MTKIQYGGYKPRWRLTTTEIYKTQKAEQMQCLESFAATQLSQPEVESIAIDGSCLAHILKPKDPTFQDYAMKTFVHDVNTYAKIHRRTDIVFDVYKENSLKMYTRLIRGKGSRRKVTYQGKMPKNWPNFFQNEYKKKELYPFLADSLKEADPQNLVFVSKKDGAIVNVDACSHLTVNLSCNHEEANTRLFVRVHHAIKHSAIKNCNCKYDKLYSTVGGKPLL